MIPCCENSVVLPIITFDDYEWWWKSKQSTKIPGCENTRSDSPCWLPHRSPPCWDAENHGVLMIMIKKEIRVVKPIHLCPGQSATSKRISGQKASRRLNPTVGNSQIKKNQRQTKIDEEKLLSDLHWCNRYLHSGRFSPKLACQTFFLFSREYFIASSSPLLSWSVLLDSFICSTNAMWKMT